MNEARLGIVLALAIVVAATAAMFNLGRIARRWPFSPSGVPFIDAQARHQVLLLGVAALVLAVLYVAERETLLAFLAPGEVAAPAGAVAWLGIPQGVSWLALGAALSLLITLGTGAFVYVRFRGAGARRQGLAASLPWVLAFSLSNSFAEEVVYRLGVVVPLAGRIEAASVLLFSAVAFGAPHLRGMPNGLLGASMAGFLGWLLAKSVLETGGLFWAWFIHFLQDVVIFAAFAMAAAGKPASPGASPAR